MQYAAMGKRGPAPTPTRLKILNGAKRTRINFDEPVPIEGRPVGMPDNLSPVAREEWQRVAPHLLHMGIVSEADTSGLAVYCEAVSRWRRLATEAADAPTYLPGERGAIKVNPIFRAEQNAATVVRILAREFGLTPSARAGIRVEHVIRGDAGRLLTSDG